MTAQGRSVWLQNLAALLATGQPATVAAPLATAAAEPPGTDAEAAPSDRRAPKVPRLAALDLLRGLNNALRSIGMSLASFMPGPWVAPQPVLTAVCDEGADNVAAAWFLSHHMGMRMICLRDPPHRQWNDARLALQHAGFWGTVLDLTVVWNSSYGPWSSSAWFKGLLEAATEMASTLQPGDPLLLWLGEHLRSESQQEALVDLTPFRTKGPRVSLSRWFSFFDATAHHIKWWYTRLCVLVFFGVQTGNVANVRDLPMLMQALTGSPAAIAGPATDPAPSRALEVAAPPTAAAAAAGTRAAAAAAGSAQSASAASSSSQHAAAAPPTTPLAATVAAQARAASKTTAHVAEHKKTASAAEPKTEGTARDSVRNVRSKCSNTLHFAAMVLARDEAHTDAAMTLAALGPLRRQHGEEIRLLKQGPEAAVALYADWATGHWVAGAYSGTLVLRDQCALASCGFQVEGCDFRFAEEDALVLQQDLAAERLDRLVFSLLKFRAQSMVWHSEGVPGLWAALLHQDLAHCEATLLKLRRLWETYRTLKAEVAVPPTVRTMLNRGPFHLPVAQEVFAHLEAAEFRTVPADLAALLRAIFSGYGSTKIIEDSFQRLRDREARDASCNNLRAARRWDVLVKADLLPGNCRRTLTAAEVAAPPQQEQPKRADKEIRRDAFEPPRHMQGALRLADITKRKTWPSPSPQAAIAHIADWGLLHQLHCQAPQRPEWGQAACSWRGACLVAGELYKAPNGAVYRALGTHGCACLAWPMVRLPHDGDSAVKWAYAQAPPQWLALLRWTDLEAIPAKTTSPLACLARGGAPFVAQMECGASRCPRLHAAHLGFPSVGAGDLGRLAKELQLNLAKCGAAELLTALVRHILGVVEEEALQVLERRCQREACASNAPVELDGERLREILGQEKKEYDEGMAAATADTAARRSLREYVKARRVAIRSARSSSCGGSAPSTGPKGSGSAGPNSSSTCSASGPADATTPYWRAPAVDAEWSTEAVLQLMPPGPVRVRRDSTQGRWIMTYMEKGSKSRSWGVWGGEANAVRAIAREAWIMHEEVAGNPCAGSRCPVLGLFAEVEDAASPPQAPTPERAQPKNQASGAAPQARRGGGGAPAKAPAKAKAAGEAPAKAKAAGKAASHQPPAKRSR